MATGVSDLPEDLIIASVYVSEGQNAKTIDKIACSVESSSNTILIDVDPNAAYQRTNILFGGPAAEVEKAAEEIAKSVFSELDFRSRGSDSHLWGVLDMVSFLPLNSQNLPLATKIAKRFAEKIAEDMQLPVQLFGDSATRNHKRYLKNFRQHPSDTLPELLKANEWEPDFGPKRFHEKWGASIIGSRLYHISLAIYLNAEEMNLLQDLVELLEPTVGEITETLASKVEIAFDEMPEEKISRLICSIPDYRETTLQIVIEWVIDMAEKLHIDVPGCELLGYTPAEALVQAGKSYENTIFFTGFEDELKYITLAIQNLQLNNVVPFDLKRQILDFHFQIDRDHI